MEIPTPPTVGPPLPRYSTDPPERGARPIVFHWGLPLSPPDLPLVGLLTGGFGITDPRIRRGRIRLCQWGQSQQTAARGQINILKV